MQIHEGSILKEWTPKPCFRINEAGKLGDLLDSIQLAWRQLEAILVEPNHDDIYDICHPPGAVRPWWFDKVDGSDVPHCKLGFERKKDGKRSELYYFLYASSHLYEGRSILWSVSPEVQNAFLDAFLSSF